MTLTGGTSLKTKNFTAHPILRHRNANDLFWKSWHFIIEGSEASKFPWDFTSISVENLNCVFIMIILKLIYTHVAWWTLVNIFFLSSMSYLTLVINTPPISSIR
jgi:hypothetical protein